MHVFLSRGSAAPTQRSMCCFLSPPSQLSPSSLQFGFSCLDPPPPVFSWSRGLQRKTYTDLLPLCSPSSQLVFLPPLCSPTNEKVFTDLPLQKLGKLSNRRLPGSSCVCLYIYTQTRTSQLKDQFSFLAVKCSERKITDLIAQTAEYPERECRKHWKRTQSKSTKDQKHLSRASTNSYFCYRLINRIKSRLIVHFVCIVPILAGCVQLTCFVWPKD